MCVVIDYMIDDSSIISKSANLGKNVEIGMFSIIGNNTIIGEDVKIGHHVVIENNVNIGNNVSMKAFCEIRSDCKIGNNVSFGSRCTLANGTIVEDNVIIKYGVVSTDTPKIDQSFRNPCVLKRGSRYGANVTLMPGITIGENSEVGACSQVRTNIPDKEVWYGNPAKFFRKA